MQQNKEVILAIDTATEICSVALFARDEILFEKINEEGRNHAALIGGYCREALEFVAHHNLSLIAIAINGGPGSYTGLRIGASFAKGLCFGRHLPLIAISGLSALASGYKREVLGEDVAKSAISSQPLLCPMIDARRMEVYCALYELDGAEVLAPCSEIVTAESFCQEIAQRDIYFFGNGAMKCETTLSKSSTHFANFPSVARNLQEVAFKALDKKDFADVAYWTPDYVKPYKAVKSINKVLSRIIQES